MDRGNLVWISNQRIVLSNLFIATLDQFLLGTWSLAIHRWLANFHSDLHWCLAIHFHHAVGILGPTAGDVWFLVSTNGWASGNLGFRLE